MPATVHKCPQQSGISHQPTRPAVPYRLTHPSQPSTFPPYPIPAQTLHRIPSAFLASVFPLSFRAKPTPTNPNRPQPTPTNPNRPQPTPMDHNRSPPDSTPSPTWFKVCSFPSRSGWMSKSKASGSPISVSSHSPRVCISHVPPLSRPPSRPSHSLLRTPHHPLLPAAARAPLKS